MNERHGALVATARRDAALFPNYFGQTCFGCVIAGSLCSIVQWCLLDSFDCTCNSCGLSTMETHYYYYYYYYYYY